MPFVNWLPIILGLAVLYLPSLYDLFTGIWSQDEQMHGPIVLGISVWLLYRNWSTMEAAAQGKTTSTWGWPVFIFGLLLYALGRSQDILLFEIGSVIWLLVGLLLLQRAALALFCPDDVAPSDFPQFKLRLARFKGTTRDEFLDNRQYAGNAFALMRRAERFLIDWLPVASKIVPGQMARIDTPALPTEATREALANAFIHRDYASAAGSVAVALYDDRLEVISSGGLHFGLTPAMLFKPHESNPWNPWIANVFYRRGYIETWGRGTLKIASLMQNAGLQAPTVVENTGFVIMTFVIPDKNVVRQPESEGVNGGVNEGVNEGVNALTEHIRRHPGLRTPALAALMKTAPKNVERWLKQLRQADKIVFVGSPKTGGYQPK